MTGVATAAPDGLAAAEVALDSASGGVRVNAPPGERRLHPIWLRERADTDPGFDPNNWQRLFEPAALPQHLVVTDVWRDEDGLLRLVFSDGATGHVPLMRLAHELGWLDDPDSPPAPVPWDTGSQRQPEAHWQALDDPMVLRELLAGFFRHGFCVIYDTPTIAGSLEQLARRFGFVRDTHFGKLFDVVTKPNPNDLAYTGRSLPPHTDNPYRAPIPGIQLLHCLTNTVAGGLSTLADGFAIANQMAAEDPAMYRALTTTQVRFRYQADTIMQSHGPLIETDPHGQLRRVRFSTRVDYVPAYDPASLDLYYRGRSRFYELARDPKFQLTNTFQPGMLIMFDNQRLLHGRGAFDQASGHRHLQGCYIDHDGPDSLYRLLVRDGQEPVRHEHT